MFSWYNILNQSVLFSAGRVRNGISEPFLAIKKIIFPIWIFNKTYFKLFGVFNWVSGISVFVSIVLREIKYELEKYPHNFSFFCIPLPFLLEKSSIKTSWLNLSSVKLHLGVNVQFRNDRFYVLFQLTDLSMQYLSGVCRHISYLDISGCYHITWVRYL